MNRSVTRTGFIDPFCDRIAAFEITPSLGRKRVFVVAMRGAISPVPAPADAYEAMPPGAGLDAEPLPPAPNRWAVPSYSLPPGNARVMSPSGDEFIAVPVRGEIVRDAAGRLFEAAGQRLRPLERLVRGPRGEFLELLPAPQPPASSTEEVFDAEFVDQPQQHRNEREGHPASAADVKPEQGLPPAAACRRIFADPGLPRLVRFGDFKAMLAPQLAHSERLRDVHRLPCYVQVFESPRDQRADSFFEAIQAGAKSTAPIQPLQDEVVAMLGLAGFLLRRPRPLRQANREPGLVLSGDRFFRLTLGTDPTAESRPASSATPPKAQAEAQEQAEAEPAPVAPAAAAAPLAPPPARFTKSEIPSRFLKAWEFQISRDEALYDIHMAASRGLRASLVRRMRRWLHGREEFHKWQALLCGKDADDQLWAVRPPRESLSGPAVRDWARRTLDAAGYDAAAMLLEWEIYWRRKGV
ncbi:MAG: hypothetical protein LAN84_08455 [Acidobacteriia bacterium]|nr:hypothetical protein [Terriglobia bacterium]